MRLTVRTVAKIVREQEGTVIMEMRLVQDAYVDDVLAEELIKFYLSAANLVGIPVSQSQGISPVCLSRPRSPTQLQRG
jgi:hypothetical protein